MDVAQYIARRPLYRGTLGRRHCAETEPRHWLLCFAHWAANKHPQPTHVATACCVPKQLSAETTRESLLMSMSLTRFPQVCRPALSQSLESGPGRRSHMAYLAPVGCGWRWRQRKADDGRELETQAPSTANPSLRACLAAWCRPSDVELLLIGQRKLSLDNFNSVRALQESSQPHPIRPSSVRECLTHNTPD